MKLDLNYGEGGKVQQSTAFEANRAVKTRVVKWMWSRRWWCQ